MFRCSLERAHVPHNDFVKFCCTTIRPPLECCAPVFHHTFPAYLNVDIEGIQERVFSIISPETPYRECLNILGLPIVYD